jgi:hypothetical protein
VDADKNLATYAILDAARIPNLPEILAQGTARHECLFKGAAYDDWGHVAPWLVALDESDVSAFSAPLLPRGILIGSLDRDDCWDGVSPWSLHWSFSRLAAAAVGTGSGRMR